MFLAELLLLGASVCVFLSCRIFLQRGLYNELRVLASATQDALPPSVTMPKPSATKSWHSELSQSSFSICFTECCMLFAMLLCQGFNILDPSIRLYTWRASLFLLLSTIIVLIPASLYMVVAYRSESPSLLNIKSVAFLLPVAFFIFVLSFIPLPADLTSHNLLTSTTARLVVLGTLDLGLLSGLGAVNGAWGIFARNAAVHSAASIASAETALERVESDLRERTRDLDAYGASKPQSDGSWLSRATLKRDAHQGSLQQEVIGLQALESQMTARVVALKRNREHNEFALSLRGKILSRVWAVYCVCRVFSSLMNLIFPPLSTDDKTSDIIAHISAHLVSLLPAATGKTSIDVPSLSRQISLVLVGAIILSSVHLVLRGVARVFRITSRNISASLMLLLLAQLMVCFSRPVRRKRADEVDSLFQGIYLLSTLVQLRTMFPPTQSSSVDAGNDGEVNLFSSLPQYSLFGGLFDWSFLFGATGCALARWAGGLFSEDVEDYA
ncbi:G protein-coupled receptor 89 [Boletus reticuloceps]|uniref:G protein-coupled receptor 89 n=1 Tax=Boletus reticuloceps TaxID=495285 RepID=A0A8I2YLS9_9AGAM|nr:G protein-coupled receptor 89 [Boletus reticuloceps]